VVNNADGGAKEVFEEGVEDGGLSLVGKDHIAILILEVFDLIFLEAPRGTKVEVARVFVAEGTVFNLSSLPPVGGTLEVFLTEVGFC
jgi:hypothetical protein